MTKPKNKKPKKTDIKEGRGGGAAPFTQEDFEEALDKVILTEKKPKRKRKLPDAGKTKTSE